MSADGLHLVVNVTGTGYHPGAWRATELAPDAFVDINYHQSIAEVAERGLFDAILLPDIPFQNAGIGTAPTQSLEPTLLCAALAATTEYLGFIPTLSSSFNMPYNLARRILTLDHASGGRAAWNVVSTFALGAAANFGHDGVRTRTDRYRQAAELVELVIGLWDSWEDDVLVGDQRSGAFADPERIHAVWHRGEFFRVEGPMNIPRSPQGRPVIVQAGASDAGTRFAASHAEVIYGSQLSLKGAIEFATRIRETAVATDRSPDHFLILPGLVPIVEEDERSARARWAELQSWLPAADSEAARLEAALWLASGSLGPDLDAPLTPDAFGRGQQRPRGFVRALTRFAAETGYSPRELVNHTLGGHRLVIGDPMQVADHIERWWRAGAVDGFTLVPAALPDDLTRFVELVVPELQRRGIYRSVYPGRTLRANLGLPVPVNAFAPLVAS
jgi:FMN-dependent oxidoreductase (nitrilotriacetate monooxygenase family)